MFQRALSSTLVLCGILAVQALADGPVSSMVSNMDTPPKAGPVELYPESALKPGMQAVAWTVLQGTKPEPIPLEIIGIWHNGWGPKQDIILGKMMGKAQRTNVAGGMSGGRLGGGEGAGGGGGRRRGDGSSGDSPKRCHCLRMSR